MRTFHSVALSILVPCSLSAQTITTVGTTFSPDLLVIEAGDIITVTLAGIHTMTEVSEATWNANGNTSNGGFDYSAGTHEFTIDQPGTYYYVCVPHAGMGMKGRIIVETNTSITPRADAIPVRLLNDRTTTHLTVTGAPAGSLLVVYDVQGSELLRSSLTTGNSVSVAQLPTGVFPVSILDMHGAVLLRDKVIIAQ